eukprot:10159456-Lingulodinium_polyedra.AAC.1
MCQWCWSWSPGENREDSGAAVADGPAPAPGASQGELRSPCPPCADVPQDPNEEHRLASVVRIPAGRAGYAYRG